MKINISMSISGWRRVITCVLNICVCIFIFFDIVGPITHWGCADKLNTALYYKSYTHDHCVLKIWALSNIKRTCHMPGVYHNTFLFIGNTTAQRSVEIIFLFEHFPSVFNKNAVPFFHTNNQLFYNIPKDFNSQMHTLITVTRATIVMLTRFFIYNDHVTMHFIIIQTRNAMSTRILHTFC